jgi:hypothetical protein
MRWYSASAWALVARRRVHARQRAHGLRIVRAFGQHRRHRVVGGLQVAGFAQRVGLAQREGHAQAVEVVALAGRHVDAGQLPQHGRQLDVLLGLEQHRRVQQPVADARVGERASSWRLMASARGASPISA